MPVTIWSVVKPMTVHFIGAGPGAADLLTLRPPRLHRARPRCACTPARSCRRELLAPCPPGARLVDTADLTLDEIIAELVAAHEAGLDVARLHSGDPSVFCALAEQMRRLDAAGVPYDVVPGGARVRRRGRRAAAGADRARGRADRHAHPHLRAAPTPMPPGEDLAELRRTGATLVLHLAVHRHRGGGRASCCRLRRRTARPRWSPSPAGTTSWCCAGTLAVIAGAGREAGIRRTAVVIVGRALAAPSTSRTATSTRTGDGR